MQLSAQQILKKGPVIITALLWATSFWTVPNNYFIWLFLIFAVYLGKYDIAKPTFHDIPFFLPVILLTIYTLGLIWSENILDGYKQVEKRSMLVVFPLAFFLLRKKITQSDITTMLYTFVVFCVGISIVCYGYAAWQSWQNGSFTVVSQTERPYYYFSYNYLTNPVDVDPIYLSLYVNLGIIILLFRPLKHRWLCIFLIVHLLIFNVLIASKAGIIGLVIIFGVYFFNLIRSKLVALGIYTVALILLVWIISSSKFLKDRFIQSTTYNYELPWAGDWNSTSQRLAIWNCAVETISKVFPLGYGTSNGQLALNEMYRSKNYVRGYEDLHDTHNEYLETLLETGVFGLAALLLIFIWPTVQSIRHKDSLFLCFLFLLFFYFFVETVLTRRVGLLFFSFFYSLLTLNEWMITQKAKNSSSDEI